VIELKDVKLCADDLLCHECELENERKLAAIRNQLQTEQQTLVPTGLSQSEVIEKSKSRKATSLHSSSTEGPADTRLRNIMVNKMLAYMRHYRVSASADKLRRTIVSFYSTTEIAEAKKKLIAAFDVKLPPDCPFRVERRKSSTRPAHDVETENVMGIFDILDRMHLLDEITFAAVAIDRIPKYGPEETNIAMLVNKHTRLESAVAEIAC
jgi:hypothetical protein